MLYTYLADSLGRPCAGSFRALTRGYLHWASGRVQKIEVNIRNPNYCHIRSSMVPSMKKGSYMVYVLLECEDGLAVVKTAACDCPAGYGFIMHTCSTCIQLNSSHL